MLALLHRTSLSASYIVDIRPVISYVAFLCDMAYASLAPH